MNVRSDILIWNISNLLDIETVCSKFCLQVDVYIES